jgi:GNAT superfamily N-acetyltransferase
MEGATFRSYCEADYEACVDIFDANCPKYFAPNERQDFEDFLKDKSVGYEVCEVDGRILGAYGLFADGEVTKVLNWILLDPDAQGLGIGSKIIERVNALGRASHTRTINIAASHMSAPFFARFGAKTLATTRNGWGTGMHRVDMKLSISK